MPHTLNFYQLQFDNDFINNAIIAETNTVRVLRPSQFFHAVRKGIFRQISNGLDNSPLDAGWQFAQILARGFLPLNAKGHGVSALS